MLFAKAAFKIGTGINSWRGMALKINQIACLIADGAPKEVVEAYLEERGERGKGRHMSADIFVVLISTSDHRQGVISNQAFDTLFKCAIAGKGHLLGRRDRVDVRSIVSERCGYASLCRPA